MPGTTGTVRLVFLGDASSALRSVYTLERGFAGLRRAALTLGTVAMTGLIGGLAASVKAAADLEQQLNVFKVTAQATGEEMAKVSKLALELGNDLKLPGVTATDAAAAMTQLSKSGFTVSQSMKSVKGVLQLATAGEIEFADAANIVAGALNAFELPAKRAGDVADLLAQASIMSSAEVEDMTMAMRQSSQQAHQFGLTIEETASALTIMANAGLRGSDAGTSLKVMLQFLAGKSAESRETIKALNLEVFDGEGKFIGMEEVIGKYNKALGKMSDQQRLATLRTIFGTDAIRAASLILGGSVSKWRAVNIQIDKQGAAATLAAAKMGGFKGALERIRNTASTTAIEMGQKLLPVFTEFANQFAVVLPNAMRAMQPTMQSIGTNMGDFGLSFLEKLPAIQAGLAGFKSAFENTLNVVRGPVTAAFNALRFVLDALGGDFETAGAKGRLFGAVLIGLGAGIASYRATMLVATSLTRTATAATVQQATASAQLTLFNTTAAASNVALGTTATGAAGALTVLRGVMLTVVPAVLIGVLAGVAFGMFALGRNASDAEQAVQGLKDSLGELTNAGMDLKQAQDLSADALVRYQDAVYGVKQAQEGLADIEKMHDDGLIKGREYRRLLEDAERSLELAIRERTNASKDAGEAVSELQLSELEAIATVRDQSGALADVGAAFDKASAFSEKYATILERIPDLSEAERLGRFSTIIGKADADIDEFKDSLTDVIQEAQKVQMNKGLAPEIKEIAGNWIDAAQQLKAYVDDQGHIPPPDEIKVILDAAGAGKNVDGLIAKLFKLGGMKATPKLELKEKVGEQIGKIGEELAALKARPHSVAVDARIEKLEAAKTMWENFQESIKDTGRDPPKAVLKLLTKQFDDNMKKANSKLGDFKKQKPKPKVDVDTNAAVGKLNVVKGLLADIDSTTAEARVNVVYSSGNRPSILRADGGFVEGFAKGGFSRKTGFVSGTDSGQGDTVKALLTPGELVLNRQQQNALGGPDFLAKLFGFVRKKSGSGMPQISLLDRILETVGGPPKFAGGGFVSAAKKKIRRSRTRDKAHEGYKAKAKEVRSIADKIEANQEDQSFQERRISQLDREYGISVEEFINVDADGNESLNQPAIDTRASELQSLIAETDVLVGIVNQETELLNQMMAAIKAAIDAYQAEIRDQKRIIREMNELIRDARKKMAEAEDDAKDSYKNVITKAEGRRGDAQGKIKDLSGRIGDLKEDRQGYTTDLRAQPFDLQDLNLDKMEYNAEIAEVRATTPRPREETSTDAAADSRLQAEIDRLLKELGMLRQALGIETAQLAVIGSFQKGVAYVPQTGVAMVHAGERIVPAGTGRQQAQASPPPIVEVSIAAPDAWLHQFVDTRVVRGHAAITTRIGREADRRSREGVSGTISAPTRRG